MKSFAVLFFAFLPISSYAGSYLTTCTVADGSPAPLNIEIAYEDLVFPNSLDEVKYRVTDELEVMKGRKYVGSFPSSAVSVSSYQGTEVIQAAKAGRSGLAIEIDETSCVPAASYGKLCQAIWTQPNADLSNARAVCLKL